jgi:hypothetical protein
MDRLDRGDQFHPGQDAVHLAEELFASGGLATWLKRDFGKCLLVHGGRLAFSAALPVAHYERGTNQTFPKRYSPLAITCDISNSLRRLIL